MAKWFDRSDGYDHPSGFEYVLAIDMDHNRLLDPDEDSSCTCKGIASRDWENYVKDYQYIAINLQRTWLMGIRNDIILQYSPVVASF